MPLIIVVLVIIVVFLNATGNTKNSERQLRTYTAAIRKTNAKLELKLVQKYYDRGKETEDRAIEQGKAELIELGFEPCIPRNTYRVDSHNKQIYVYHSTYDYQRFDSDAVRSLNADFKRQNEKSRRQFSSNEDFEIAREEYVYKDFPGTISEYKQYQRLSARKLDAISIGSFVSYPGLGTCEVVDLDFELLQQTLKSVKTGETKKVVFGDSKIIEL